MSELTLTIMRLGLLVLLWLFVFSLAGVLRGDLYGTRVVSRVAQQPSRGERKKAQRAHNERRRERGKRVPTHLVVTAGRLAGTSMPLRDSGVLIGRNPECSLVLDDDYASGRHARIIRSDGGWLVEDLGSTNGTYVGGQRVHGAIPVESGSAIRIGTSVIELRN